MHITGWQRKHIDIYANDRADLIDTFKEWPTDREIPKLYTAPMEELLKNYYIVGGE